MSDINTALVDRLKALDPNRPIREADMLSDIRYRHFVDLVTMRIDDRDEPAAPIPSRHDGPVFEVTRQRQRIFASGSIAWQINTFVIVQNLFAVTEVEVITRHGEMIRREK